MWMKIERSFLYGSVYILSKHNQWVPFRHIKFFFFFSSFSLSRSLSFKFSFTCLLAIAMTKICSSSLN